MFEGHSSIKTVEAANYVLKSGEVILNWFETDVVENTETEEVGMLNGNSVVLKLNKPYSFKKVFYIIGKKTLSMVGDES